MCVRITTAMDWSVSACFCRCKSVTCYRFFLFITLFLFLFSTKPWYIDDSTGKPRGQLYRAAQCSFCTSFSLVTLSWLPSTYYFVTNKLGTQRDWHTSTTGLQIVELAPRLYGMDDVGEVESPWPKNYLMILQRVLGDFVPLKYIHIVIMHAARSAKISRNKVCRTIEITKLWNFLFWTSHY